MTGQREKLQTWGVCAALAVFVMALFWGALDCEFVNYDDPAYITSNQEVQRGINARSIAWAFTSGAATNWHPLTWLSHIVDFQLYGMKPAGHHLTSILLHAANSILLFLILKRMTGAMWRSAFVAAFFALHPLRVESVVWISERKDVLSTLFWMLTVWAYIRYAEALKPGGSRPARFYILSAAFFACGLMSKPMVVTLPFVLLLLDYWPLQRKEKWKALVIEKIPFFILAVASSVVTFIVQKRGGAVSSLNGISIGPRICNAFISYVRYLEKAVCPVHLSVLYPHPGYWPVWQTILAVIFLILVTWLVVWRWRLQPYLAVGWFWYLVILAPTIGLIQVGVQSMADRYSYVPLVGIFIMIVWGVDEIAVRHRLGRQIAGVCGGAALAGCMVLTPIQVTYWQTSLSLFLHAVAVTDKNYLAYNNIGFFLDNKGRGAEAMKYYQKSIDINPRYEEARNNLGYVLAAQGHYQEAIDQYIKALSINPKLAVAHNNLGNALSNVGRIEEAMSEYQRALDEDPHFADAHNNYGIALAMRGKIDEAIAHFHEAVRDKPTDAGAHSNLGNAFAAQGKFEDAIAEYRICMGMSPNDSQAHNNLANVYMQLGNVNDAVDNYRVALKLTSNNPETHFNLGYALAKQGKAVEAAREYEIALQQRPGYPDAIRELSALRTRK